MILNLKFRNMNVKNDENISKHVIKNRKKKSLHVRIAII